MKFNDIELGAVTLAAFVSGYVCDDWLGTASIVALWICVKLVSTGDRLFVMPLALTFQWAQVALGVLYKGFTGREVQAHYLSNYRPMVWIGLGCCLALAAGIKLGLHAAQAAGPERTPTRDGVRLPAAAGRLRGQHLRRRFDSRGGAGLHLVPPADHDARHRSPRHSVPRVSAVHGAAGALGPAAERAPLRDRPGHHRILCRVPRTDHPRRARDARGLRSPQQPALGLPDRRSGGRGGAWPGVDGHPRRLPHGVRRDGQVRELAQRARRTRPRPDQRLPERRRDA